MNTEEKAKAYDEALERARKMLNMILDNELLGFPDQIREIFPQLRESEDGRIRKEIIDFIQWAEDRGMTRHDYHQAKRPAVWIAYLEKQKECVVDNNKTSAEEDERIRARLIEYFQGFLEGYEDCYKDGGCVKWEGLDVKSILAWLEKQKKTADSFTDGIIEVRSFQRGMEEGRKLETQKEPGIKWLKSDNVKNPDKPYVDKAGMFYTTDGRMCYASEIEKQKEQKHPNGCFTCDEYKKGYEEGRRNGFTAGYNKAMKEVEQKEQKPSCWNSPVMTNEMIMDEQKPDSLIYDKDLDKAAREFYLSGGADSPVDSTGLVPIVRMAEFGATWMKDRMEKEQKPAEWDDYTKTNLGRAIQIIKDARGTLHGYQTDDGIYECDKAIEALEHFLYRGLEIEKSAEWSEEDENKIESIKGLITMGKFVDTNTIKTIWKLLDSLRPQPKVEWSEEDDWKRKELIQYLEEKGDYRTVWMTWLKSLSPH